MKQGNNNLINPRSGDNAKDIRLALVAWDLPSIDITDPKQVQDRINTYFIFCELYNRFPCIAGLSNWLGVHRDTVNSWKNGFSRKETHQKIIQRAYDVIEFVLISMLTENVIFPASGIFLLKSMFGYQDKIRIDVETGVGTTPLDSLDPELARRHLLEAIPEDEKGDDCQ